MRIWFSDDDRRWPVPVEALLAIAKDLSAAQETSVINPTDALFLATGFEAAAETGAAEVGIDSGNRETFRWGLERWAEKQDELPPWAIALGEAVNASFTNPPSSVPGVGSASRRADARVRGEHP